MSTCAIPQSPWPPEAQAGFKYVGFIDILGFSNRVLADSETVINEYQEFCELLLDGDIDRSVELTVYSDAIMLVSDKLAALAHFAQAVCFFALNRNLVVRGGISYGRFWSKSHARGLMVVSEALVRAVQMEKEIGHPAIVFDETIAFPDPFWAEHLADREHTVSRPVIHFDGLNMINPFNTFWFRTARTRVLARLEEATRPQHRAKYQWFLGLWTAMNEFEPMTPAGVDERLMATGILEWIALDESAQVRSYRIPPDEL